ncbi:MAG: hypothetical protein WC966_04130 [Bradymonadales bacterium]|jgi:hypothetical protein
MAKQVKTIKDASFKEITKQMLDAAKAELVVVEEQRKLLIAQIKNCELMMGMPDSNERRSAKAEEVESLPSEEPKKPSKAKAEKKAKKAADSPRKVVPRRKAMIKTGKLKQDILDILAKRGTSLSNAEILAELNDIDGEVYLMTNSLRARLSTVYKLLIKEKKMEKLGRGIYKALP